MKRASQKPLGQCCCFRLCNSKHRLRLHPRSPAQAQEVLQNPMSSDRGRAADWEESQICSQRLCSRQLKDLVLKMMFGIKTSTLSGDRGMFQNLVSLLSFLIGLSPSFLICFVSRGGIESITSLTVG